ncbi:MAG TPA: hydrogenase maturation nickel metallochaperone HypA [Candidatus Limnocylindrales bacterium]|nr:hydrogenase maturation nickel metallochaperone HypA [Candidatus Limnocylindrales bacterium]
MHELGITQEIVAIAAEVAGGAPIRRIVVEVGRLTAVLPDAVRFCFEACSEGTPAAGAALDIIEIPARARCRACGCECVLDQPFGFCSCGRTEFEWLSGEELRVSLVEVQ